MFSIYDQLPRYLLGKYQLTMTVMFTVLFSMVFILVSIPFSHNAWFRLGQDQAFLYTVVFFILAILVVIFSRRLMYSQRYATDFSYLHYILWNIAEIVVISLLYAVFTTEAGRTGLIEIGERDFFNILESALVFTAVSLGVPYLVSSMYFALEEKNNTIRMMNYGNVVSDMDYPDHQSKRITLFDNNGVLKFSTSAENLYFIESDDNYIKVWYMDNTGAMKQYMLRCRLKTIEDSFADSDLVRCHRKYVVNISKVKVLKAEKDGYYIDLDIESVEPIPISKTYEQAVLARFNSR